VVGIRVDGSSHLEQELNLSRCTRLWTLPDSLLHLVKLQLLHIPSRAIAQHLIEQLELRDPVPVDVDSDPEEDEGFGDEAYDMSGSEEYVEAFYEGLNPPI